LTDVKGNRNEIEGKKIFGIYDILHPDGGNDRKFRPLWMKTFRYIQIDVETKDQELVLNDFRFEFNAYPFKEVAKFNTKDETLSQIWDVAWRTVRNGSGEMFQDSPYYEQMQYIGDTRLESMISVYVSGDDRLMRKAIKVFDESRMPNGLTESRYPSYITQVIPTYSLLWVSMLHDYYMIENDPEFLRQFMPGMRGVLEWFENEIDETGMPASLEWWNFTDWVNPEFPNGIPKGADDGHSANVALQYVYTLDNAVELFKHFGWDHEAKKYAALSAKVKKATYNKCFDTTKGMFAETPEKTLFTQHTNIFAVLTNSIPADQQKELMEKVMNDKDVVHTSIYFKFYLFRALQKVGMGDEYFNELQPWKNMLDAGLTTFAETDINPRSDCHAWSATPCFDMLSLVAGINPAEPGFKSINIEPNFGYLKDIDASMPHPNGIISVKISKSKKGKVKGTIELPENTTGTFIWNGTSHKLVAGENKINVK
ncbi:MAG: alpha-rhamnosidase, partial [Flavobacteriales bacterium]|nr:alpha-rhamnosidase [Flavobacteriales bacterium]